jgi:hypothetical protein
MSDDPNQHLDILAKAEWDEAIRQAGKTRPPRPWVGIHFECCDVYTRVYRDLDAPQYRGRCPRCGRPVTLRVDPDGVSARIFRATPT